MRLPQDEITEQLQLLAIYRRNLALFIQQQAMIGKAYSPLGIINGIAEAREQIHRIKTLLRTAGITVDEDPDDEEFI
jgi:hypothetical protein